MPTFPSENASLGVLRKRTIARVVQDHFGAGSEDMKQIRRHGNDARIAVVYLIRRLTNEKVTKLADQYGGVSVAAISKLLRRAE